jgi:hypothetical protein
MKQTLVLTVRPNPRSNRIGKIRVLACQDAEAWRHAAGLRSIKEESPAPPQRPSSLRTLTTARVTSTSQPQGGAHHA